MHLSFDAFVFSDESDTISEPIEKDGTWYLLLNGEKKEGAQAEFEEVKEQILIQLSEEAKKDSLKEVLEKLRSKAKIEEKEVD